MTRSTAVSCAANLAAARSNCLEFPPTFPAAASPAPEGGGGSGAAGAADSDDAEYRRNIESAWQRITRSVLPACPLRNLRFRTYSGGRPGTEPAGSKP